MTRPARLTPAQHVDNAVAEAIRKARAVHGTDAHEELLVDHALETMRPAVARVYRDRFKVSEAN